MLSAPIAPSASVESASKRPSDVSRHMVIRITDLLVPPAMIRVPRPASQSAESTFAAGDARDALTTISLEVTTEKAADHLIMTLEPGASRSSLRSRHPTTAS